MPFSAFCVPLPQDTHDIMPPLGGSSRSFGHRSSCCSRDTASNDEGHKLVRVVNLVRRSFCCYHHAIGSANVAEHTKRARSLDRIDSGDPSHTSSLCICNLTITISGISTVRVRPRHSNYMYAMHNTLVFTFNGPARPIHEASLRHPDSAILGRSLQRGAFPSW